MISLHTIGIIILVILVLALIIGTRGEALVWILEIILGGSSGGKGGFGGGKFSGGGSSGDI